MNARTWLIGLREYLAFVRTKTFILSVLMLPLIFALAFGLPALMESAPKPPRSFTILDLTGRYGEALSEQLLARHGTPGRIVPIEMRAYRWVPPAELPLPPEAEARADALREMAMADEIFAYFVVRAEGEGYRLDFYTQDPSAERLARLVRGILDETIAVDRLAPLVGEAETVRRALRGATLEVHAVTKEGVQVSGAAQVARAYAPIAFVYLLWIAILSMSSHLLTSTIEEKTSRIAEVILSSAAPSEFLGGKLLGLAGAGLTMIACWILTAMAITTVVPSPLLKQVFSGLGSAFDPLTILGFLVFFLLGFFFYAALHLAIGSVCNTIREAQSLMQPVMIVMMIPLFLMVYVANNPDHIVAVLGSLFPPFTPFLMMNRIPANPAPPLWQILLAAGLMVLATWGVVRAAAKVFRIGILMYGKPPALREILRWARERG
ncbi:MAG: ABC transporter permease [Candidatus Eisenbacteria bacterium]|uniref:ABC transporter permease n=1 Tax=Eiseniibacteriota bacterium TaxID=2212470 RepID=A0A937XBI9_UNCEI|nr:ABC transporter permease [Candidatus Eisenbacteria bacterium]